MEWHNEKLLPNGLPELIYQVTPPEITKRLRVIAFPRKDKRGLNGRSIRSKKVDIIHLYPTIIINSSGGQGVISFNYWSDILRTILHEIGHLVNPIIFFRAQLATQKMYDEHGECYSYVEKLADNWCNKTIDKIAIHDTRLGQKEGWIGGLPGIYIIRKWDRSRKNSGYNSFSCGLIDNYRAYKCGGQFSLTDLIFKINQNYDWRFNENEKRKLRKLAIKKAANLGIERYYIDRANRKHLFFNYSELIAILENMTILEPKNESNDDFDLPF